MPDNHPLGFTEGNVFLEAEVHPDRQNDFSNRYMAATNEAVVPGAPPSYQNQPNKWGAELRIYFNAPELSIQALAEAGYTVETTSAYKEEFYSFRINNNDLWWELVEKYGFRLGIN